MKPLSSQTLVFRDLIAEMDRFNDLAVDSVFSEEAAIRFKKCVAELENWDPENEPSFDVLNNGLFAMIAGAHALHNAATIQAASGDDETAAASFWTAQDFLRKAVVILQRSVEQVAGITKEAAAETREASTLH